MKTTIDFPDKLLHRAKVVATERRTTLRELVVKGLESVTSGESDEEKEKARRMVCDVEAQKKRRVGAVVW